MIITYGEAKKIVAPYAAKAGLCPDEEAVNLFLKEVIQELLFRGSNGGLRKWVFRSNSGFFTAPSDMELPIKVRFEDTIAHQNAYHHDGMIHGGHSGFVYDKWYEFYDQSTLNDCMPAEKGLVEEPNLYFTAFDPPACGARILVVPYCEEDKDAHIIVRGYDECGRKVFVQHKGNRDFAGEHISISKDPAKYSKTKFTKITGILKTPTKHYIRIYAYDPATNKMDFLAQYKPTDTTPSFRRFRIVGRKCNGCMKITVLGRIRFCDNYHDNDIIPISNIRALKLMAQAIQNEDNDNNESAAFKNQRVEQVLINESNYTRTAQSPVDFFVHTAPGNMKNMI